MSPGSPVVERAASPAGWPAPLDLHAAPQGEVALFVRRVGDLLRAPAVTCAAATPAVDAARLMTRQAVGSVVIVAPDGQAVGIVTDRDLRRKVVAQDLSPRIPVGSIMSSPLVTIERGSLAFDALLEMTRRNIHHLAVLDGAQLAGVVSSHDIMWLQGAHPVMLARDIEAQGAVQGLGEMAPRLQAVVRWLFEGGAGALPIGQIVAALNDRLVRRVVHLAETALAEEAGGPAPAAYAWVALGSEGRREQTLRTDQDNALVYDDRPAAERDAAAEYFGRLARRASDALAQAGFPVCEGGFMASNPRWCQPVAAWQRCFDQWMATPRPEALLFSALFFDWRPVAGHLEVGQRVWEWVCDQAPARTVFLRHMAKAAVERPPPLGLFGGLRPERSGPGRGTIDLKARGLFPFTQALRVHALALGLMQTNTLDRLREAARRGVFDAARARELVDAVEVLSRLRLARQLERIEAGAPPDNAVDPRELGRADQVLLREAFRTLGWLQRGLEERFQTGLIA